MGLSLWIQSVINHSRFSNTPGSSDRAQQICQSSHLLLGHSLGDGLIAKKVAKGRLAIWPWKNKLAVETRFNVKLLDITAL